MRLVIRTLAVAVVAAGILGPVGSATAQQTVAAAARPSTDSPDDLSLLDRPANLQVRDVRMAVALARLAEGSGVNVAFSPNALPARRRITCACASVTVGQALDTVLIGTPFDYLPLHDQIVIVPAPEPSPELHLPAPRVYYASAAAPAATIRPIAARQGTLTGRVTELGTARPLAAARVQILAANLGALTDADGRYRIDDVPAGDVEVQVQLLGYVTASQRVTVATEATSTVDFELAPDPLALDEVVAVGYGTAERRDLTGSITSLTERDLAAGFRPSLQQMIQGRAAGVEIIKSSGKPGGSSVVRVRGGTSISASNDPLYVIDGVPIAVSSRQNSIGGGGGSGFQIFDQEPVNPLNALNPADIESIDILKDASAAAIYGSRGANGVIIITTKRGEPGGLQTRYETRFGLSTVSKTLDVLSADQYRATAGELGLTIDDRGASTNWQDEIFRTAPSQSHNLSLSGGSATNRYRASFGYSSQDGIVLNSGIETFTGRLSTDHSALDGKLLIDLNLTAAQIGQDNAPISNQLSGEGANMLKDALRFNPTFPVYEADGNFSYLNQFSINPVSYAAHIDDETATQRILGNVHSNLRLADPLSLDVNLAYTYQDVERKAYVPKVNPLGQGVQGRALAQSSADWSKLLETTLRFEHAIGEDHRIDAIGGYSYQYFRDEGSRAQASGFISDAFKWYDLAAASTIDALTSYQESNTLISFYGRVNYSIGDRYLFTATLRRDGSSRFGEDNKWGLFPSGSVAWRISDEPFMPRSAALSELKLRASYGITGNQEIGNRQSLSTLGASSSGYIIGGERRTVVLPEQFPNPDLKWEETAQLNVGVDYELFDGRIYGTMDYYNKKTTDLLLAFAVPSPSVVSTQLANVGEVRNEGVELSIGSRLIQRADLSWGVDANFSANRSEVLSLSDATWSQTEIRGVPLSGFGFSAQTSQIITPGQPLGTFYGPVHLGMENGREIYADADGNPTDSPTEHLTFIGNAQPDFSIGLSNRVFYKDWDFSTHLRGQFGHEILNNTAMDLQNKNLLPGQNILTPGLEDGLEYGGGSATYSSRWIEDGSFVRLNDVTIGYTFDVSRLLRDVPGQARVYLTGENLFVLTGYSGYDPEVSSHVTGAATPPRGLDYMSYPRARTISLGASIAF